MASYVVIDCYICYYIYVWIDRTKMRDIKNGKNHI